jgi:hypothetical protein
VHHVEHQLDPEPVELRHPLVGVRPVEVAPLGFEDVPRERVAQVGHAQVVAGAGKVFPPEAVVLRPVKLVDVEVGQERALDARAPDELLDRERRRRVGDDGGGGRAGPHLLRCVRRTGHGGTHARTIFLLKPWA